MGNYLWHKVSDAERKKIEKEAKDLILEFGDTLSKLPRRKEALVERDSDVREESKVCKLDSTFRDLMFENAPDVKDDCITAEKGEWTK